MKETFLQKNVSVPNRILTGNPEKQARPLRRKLLPLLFLLLLLCLGASRPAYAAPSVKNLQTVSGGKFQKIKGNWYYYYKDGTVAKDCLLKISGKIYYFSESGVRQYSWKRLDGKLYYFGTKAQGYMYRKKWVKNSAGNYFWLGADGVICKGLTKINGSYYYLSPKNAARQYGWQWVGKKLYFFGRRTTDGSMYRKKWLDWGGERYYLQSDGTRATGWKTIGGKQYYFSKVGRLYRGKHKIGNTVYYFDSTSGALLSREAKLTVSSDCAVLVNASTGEVLYDKNGSTKHANASTTKILTAILALEKTSLTDKVTASANAASQEPTKLYLHAGEVFYMKDLLYSLLVPSHNDTAVAIAEHISGSTSKFVTLMNKKAKALGCTSTHFATPNGLDQGLNHYTTARDLAIIARYAWKNSVFRQIVSTKSYSFTSISGYSYWFQSTDSLLGNFTGLLGGKTGYTNKAGYCFVGFVKSKNGQTYISVTLGASTSYDRWNDAKTLMSYAYNMVPK